MTDLDERINETLHERAEGAVDADRLLRASRARGRRRQLHRRVAAGTALSLIGALGVVGVTGTGLDGLTGRLPWAATTSTGATPVPPRVDGVPGAAADPALVGSDPNVLHFGLDPTRARYLGWEVSDGGESVRLSVAGGEPVRVDLSSSPELPGSVEIDSRSFDVTAPGPQTFDGEVRPVLGMARGLVKLWQPAPGLYARAVMLDGDRAVLTEAVKALRWNEARRCAAPLRLDALPAGAKVTSCSVGVASYPRLITARFTFKRLDYQVMWLRYQYLSTAGTSTRTNRTIAGRPAFLSSNGTSLELVGIKGTTVAVDFGLPPGGGRPPSSFTEADATVVLAGARFAADPTRPESWE